MGIWRFPWYTREDVVSADVYQHDSPRAAGFGEELRRHHIETLRARGVRCTFIREALGSAVDYDFWSGHGGDVSIGRKKPGRSAGEGLCFLKQREHLGGVSKVDFADCGRLCAGETCGL